VKRYSFALVTVLILILSVPLRAQSPERGNYVPSDLKVKTHPFVENFRYGGTYHSGRLLKQKPEGWTVRIFHHEEPREHLIPMENINIDPGYRQPSQPVLIKETNNSTSNYLVTDLDRTNRYIYLLGATVLFCLLVGGWITVRAMTGILVGLGYLFWVGIPGIAGGSFALVHVGTFFLLVAAFVLPGSLGLNRKTLSALATALTAGLLSGIVLYGVGTWLHVVGLRNESLQVLEYARRYYPNRTGDFSLLPLIVGGSLIGSLGVILDVTVDVTSSTAEIGRARPDLPLAEHLNRSLTISGQLIGTMTNTLLLAYIGTDLFLILTIYLLPTPSFLILNKDFVAIEVLRGLGGVLGFLAAAPLSILFYRWFQPEAPSPPSPSDSGRPD
jgi:uncharacterized membrane protein